MAVEYPYPDKTQIFNTDVKEQDLAVFKNIESVYSPLPTNHGRSFKYDMGFWSDVVDEWNLYWMGQVWQNRDNGWADKGVDPEYDPFAKENLEGYENYASKFTDVINQEHHDQIKLGIDKNLSRRERLNASDRGIMPALVAGLGDPINWIPIPFVRGIGFGSRFLKGGAVAAGLVGATEPIRRTLDPTSTNEETAAYIAGSFFLGGLLSGTFGKRIARETIKNKGGVNGLAKSFFHANNKVEGKPMYEVEGFDWKIGEDAYSAKVVTGNTNRYTQKKYHPVWMDITKPTTAKFVTTADTIKIDKQITAIQDEIVSYGLHLTPEKNTTLKNKIAKLEEKKSKLQTKIGAETKAKYTMTVDEVHLRNLYAQAKIHPEVFGASPMKRDIFKTPDDFIKFMMKKEVYKKLKYFKKEPAETLIEAENRLNAMVYDDLVKSSKMDQGTDTNKFLEFVESWANYGAAAKLSRKLKDPWFAKRMQEISGDFGTATYANKHGVATNNSAYLESNTKWFRHYYATIHGMKDDWNQYRTGNANSKKVLDMNLDKGILQTQDAMSYLNRKVGGRNDPTDPNKLTWDQYKSKAFHAVVEPRVYNDPAVHPMIRKSADRARKFFKDYGDDAEDMKMFVSQGAYKRWMDTKAGIIEETTALLEKKALNKWQIVRLKKFLQRNEDRYREIKKELDEYMDEGISPPHETKDTYATRMWRLDKIEQNPDALKLKLENHFKNNPLRLRKKKPAENIVGKQQPEYISTDPAKVKARVDKAFENITEEARNFDGEGFAGWKNGKAGARPLMSRKLDIPNRDVIEFIETDMEYVMRQYYMRMSPAIELTRNFGDKHLDNFMDRAELRLITKHLKKDSDNKDIDKMLNYFEDERDKVLNIFNLEDPSSLSKRSASFLRDYASLAFMGKVIFSAQVDMARPIANNGFYQTFKHGRLPKFLMNIGRYKDAIAEVKFLSPAQEIVMGSARKRHIEDGGQIGLGKTKVGRIFDKFLGEPFHKAQGPFYIANLLAPWTVLWKDFQGVISAHRLIEDSLKVSKGIASEFELTRLASYGIDAKTAKLIASMPYEQIDGNLYVPNSGKWANYNGGLQATHKFRQALYGDINRTIITPSTADQFNLMHGVFRINSDDIARQWDNPLGKWLGFTKTERGGKISNSYMGLPFQFFSWAVSANRKLLISGFQGREMNAMSGVIAMITFGMMGDYFKNPRYWTQKSLEEKIIRGVELSGIAGIFTDMNFMLETVSSGMFDTPMGIRPMLGEDLRFGDPDVADALGEFTGAGPSIPVDLLYAFMTDQDYDEKSATMRRIIPLNTLWFWDRKFKSLWNWGEDKLRH